MLRSVTRLSRRRGWATAAFAAAALALLAATARVLAPASLAAVAEFPRVRPADLAHLLADVTTHALIPTPWTLEEEAGNYSSWRYVVSYSCGARCDGRASVVAHEETLDTSGGSASGPLARLQHGAAPAHRVRLLRRHCARLPLLPWPQICEEIETTWVITRSGSGARLSEQARGRCGGAAALLAACAGAAQLRAARGATLRRLRDLLGARVTI